MVSIKLERAKRLELISLVLQVCLGKDAYEILVGRCVAGHAQAPERVSPTNEVEVWNHELQEIMTVWPKIRERVQHGVMTVVRSHCSGSIRV